MADDERLTANLAQIEQLRQDGHLTDDQAATARFVLYQRAAGNVAAPPAPQATATLPPPETAPSPPATPVPIVLPSETPKGLMALVPGSWLEAVLTTLFVLGVVGLLMVVVGELGSMDTRSGDEFDPAALVPSKPPAGFETGVQEEIPGVDDGPLTPADYAEIFDISEDEARGGFVRGHQQSWRRDGALAQYRVNVHPDSDVASEYLRGTRERLGEEGTVGVVASPYPSALVFVQQEGFRAAEALIVREAVSVEVALAGDITENDAEVMARAGVAELGDVPTTTSLCITDSNCRARQLPLIFLFATPLGGIALALEGARRRRLGLGLPVWVPGLLGFASRARAAGRIRHRSVDVLLFEDSLVIARAGFAGVEMVIGALVAGFIGAYAGLRAQARRDATRRNEIAVTAPDVLAAAHPSNRVIPYRYIERVEVLASDKKGRGGRARIFLGDGKKLQFSWAASYNKHHDVPRDLVSAIGADKVTVRYRRVRPYMWISVVFGVLLTIGILAALSAPPS